MHLFNYIDPRKWGVRSTFVGDNRGPYYETGGRGGLAIQHPMNVLQGAVLYTPKLAVNSITTGYQIAGSYDAQPLAQAKTNT